METRLRGDCRPKNWGSQNELGVECHRIPRITGQKSGHMDSQADVTVLLAKLAKGNQDAGEKLVPLVYDELKRLARRYMRRERPDHTLQATALVHEAYFKLVRQQSVHWEGRSHFFGIAARLMRRILIDHARGHLREKRGGANEVLPLNEELLFSPERSEELVRLDDALERLSAIDARQGQIVELRFFGGLSVEETAAFLRISPKTVKRDWAIAKAWLHGELRMKHGNVP
jgi:RNA polymerase sigma-70 factor, ECF subfamily